MQILEVLKIFVFGRIHVSDYRNENSNIWK